MEDSIDKLLFPSGKPTEPAAIDRLAEQYRLAVEMWDRVRARRQLTNTFYLTINSAFVAGIKIADIETIKPSFRYLSVVGLIVCALWIASILNYKSLTDVKQRVIVQLEQVLPCAPFSAEASQDKHGDELFRVRH